VVVANNCVECTDVGIDFEGCYHCIANANTVKNAQHGGITSFYGSSGLIISDNSIQQYAGIGPGIEFWGGNGGCPELHNNVLGNNMQIQSTY
jgi:hypothetical protein